MSYSDILRNICSEQYYNATLLIIIKSKLHWKKNPPKTTLNKWSSSMKHNEGGSDGGYCCVWHTSYLQQSQVHILLCMTYQLSLAVTGTHTVVYDISVIFSSHRYTYCCVWHISYLQQSQVHILLYMTYQLSSAVTGTHTVVYDISVIFSSHRYTYCCVWHISYL